MTRTALHLAALVAGLALATTAAAQATSPAATIAQLSGQVMVVKADGRPRILSVRSRVEAGDTLVSEAGTHVKLLLDNGNEAVLGPLTSLQVARMASQETALVLVAGHVQVTGGLQQGPGHRFTLRAGDTTIDAGSASFTAAYSAPPATTVAMRQAYLRSSLAAAATGSMTDMGSDLPLRQVIAQLVPPPSTPGAPGLPAGLYVSVIDGAISLTNRGGTATFTSGQFGYVGGINAPPVGVPANPGIRFTLPATFGMPTASGAGVKAASVDCEVR